MSDDMDELTGFGPPEAPAVNATLALTPRPWNTPMNTSAPTFLIRLWRRCGFMHLRRLVGLCSWVVMTQANVPLPCWLNWGRNNDLPTL